MKSNSIYLVSALALILLSAIAPAQNAQSGRPLNSPQEAGAAATSNGSQGDADLRLEVEDLKRLVREQQKKIDALETGRANTTHVAAESSVAVTPQEETSPASDVPPAVSYRQSPLGQQAGSSDERIRNLEREIKGLGPISLSGDVRLRGEPIFGGPSDESLDRARARVRARFNATANLGEQFRTGITLASGDVNDPTTTNQTLSGFYTRKAIALDQAFVEYSPKEFKPLTVIGGKFRYPWYNTELTWDKDLNPEGAAETLAFNLDTPVLKRIAFIGFQLPFAEMAGTTATNKRITQQITYGGQLQTAWQLGPRITLSAYSGYYDFRGADADALALARASTKNPQTPVTGIFPLGVGNPVQNSTYTTTASNVITVGGTVYPTGAASITNAQFASKFGLFDNIARLDVKTGHDRLPLSFIGDYVQNTEACGNVANLLAVPKNTPTQTYKQTVNARCTANQRRGYWAEGRVGRLQKKGDLQMGYTRIYIEREAVLGNFNYSDIRQGTNVTQHRLDTFYQFDRNVQLGFTALVGRPLGTTEPWLTRLQFDTVFIF